MSALILPSRFNQQPQQPPQLDRGNPLAVGLIAGVIPFQRVDFVTGRQYTQSGTFATGAAPAGVGLVTDGTAAYIVAPIPQIVLTQWTIFAVLKANAPASDARAVSLANSTTSTPYVQIGTGPADAKLVRVLAQNDASGLPANQPSVAFGFDGPTRTIALTYDGSNVRCYIDGVLDTTAATSTGSTWTINQFAVGAHVRTSAAAFWRGSAFLATAHKRALFGAEIKSLTANPWQLFPAPRRLWAVPAAGGTDTPISPDSAAFAITSYAPSIAQSANQSIAPGVSTLALTGYAPTVARTVTQDVQPDAGAVAVTGYAPSITQSASQTLQPAASAMVITGYAPAVVRTDNQAVTPAAAALAVTGYAPTVTQGITTNINPGAAALALSGYAPAIAQTANQALNPGSAAVALAGYAPTVSRTANLNLPLVAGALALTGYPPTITQAPPPADPRYARPSFDLAAGPWLPSTGSSLAAVIDEPSADATDFIKTTSPGACRVQLNPVVPPVGGTRQVVRYQAWSPTGDRLAVRLLQGSTVIASWAHEPAPLVEMIFAQQLTAGQVAAISDWSALAFEFEAY